MWLLLHPTNLTLYTATKGSQKKTRENTCGMLFSQSWRAREEEEKEKKERGESETKSIVLVEFYLFRTRGTFSPLPQPCRHAIWIRLCQKPFFQHYKRTLTRLLQLTSRRSREKEGDKINTRGVAHKEKMAQTQDIVWEGRNYEYCIFPHPFTSLNFSSPQYLGDIICRGSP